MHQNNIHSSMLWFTIFKSMMHAVVFFSRTLIIPGQETLANIIYLVFLTGYGWKKVFSKLGSLQGVL
jgi:hypothetical protein